MIQTWQDLGPRAKRIILFALVVAWLLPAGMAAVNYVQAENSRQIQAANFDLLYGADDTPGLRELVVGIADLEAEIAVDADTVADYVEELRARPQGGISPEVLRALQRIEQIAQWIESQFGPLPPPEDPIK